MAVTVVACVTPSVISVFGGTLDDGGLKAHSSKPPNTPNRVNGLKIAERSSITS